MSAASGPLHRNTGRALLVVTALTAGLVLGVGATGLWVRQHIDARLLLTQQPGRIVMHEALQASVTLLDPLDIRLDDTLHTRVPVNQTVAVHIHDTLDAFVDLDGEVPVRLEVRVRDSVPVDLVLDLDTTVDVRVLGAWREIPMRARIPVHARIPVELTIPVQDTAHVRARMPVRVHLADGFAVALKTEIEADVPIRTRLTVPAPPPMRALVDLQETPLNISIEHADLRLPLRHLRLQRSLTADLPRPPAEPAP